MRRQRSNSSVPRAREFGVRRFTEEDQFRFAAMSGDWNPIHVDPLAARRLLFGQVVVHGMHLAIWALDCWQRSMQPERSRVRGIAAQFIKPVFLEENVAVVAGDDPWNVVVQVRDASVALIRLDVEAGVAAAFDTPAHCAPYPRAVPVECDVAGLAGRSGHLQAAGDHGELAQAFPGATALLGPSALARLMSLTRLVGMECPGLHSVFSSFDVLIAPPGPVGWRVVSFRPQLSLIKVEVSGGLTGRIEAFVRPRPRSIGDPVAVATAVEPGEFAGQNALIVGGSRGLGEVMAKVVAAGGSRTMITWHTGEADAAKVVGEIRARDGNADLVRLDVADPGPALARLAEAGWRPTHVYYFATPRILIRRSTMFERDAFSRFTSMYVLSLFETWEACRRIAGGRLRLFYPSTVALDGCVRDMVEYSAAKAAGEALCAYIARFGGETAVLVKRLPRIETDQTASLFATPGEDAIMWAVQIARTLRDM